MCVCCMCACMIGEWFVSCMCVNDIYCVYMMCICFICAWWVCCVCAWCVCYVCIFVFDVSLCIMCVNVVCVVCMCDVWMNVCGVLVCLCVLYGCVCYVCVLHVCALCVYIHDMCVVCILWSQYSCSDQNRENIMLKSRTKSLHDLLLRETGKVQLVQNREKGKGLWAEWSEICLEVYHNTCPRPFILRNWGRIWVKARYLAGSSWIR